MPSFGIDWLAPVRSFRNFFGTYGTTQGSVRGVLNAIVPVAVVDRYRDDDEGSIFSMTLTALCQSGNHAAFAVGSSADDWELHAASWGTFWPNGFPNSGPTWLTRNLMIYTPDVSYQPVETFAPAGIFVPGLNSDWAFTFGSVFGFAGYNSGLPSTFGRFPFDTGNTARSGSPLTQPDFQEMETRFDPPIRIYRDVTLGFIEIGTFGKDTDVTLSLSYRKRPRTTDGPRSS